MSVYRSVGVCVCVRACVLGSYRLNDTAAEVRRLERSSTNNCLNGNVLSHFYEFVPLC